MCKRQTHDRRDQIKNLKNRQANSGFKISKDSFKNMRILWKNL